MLSKIFPTQGYRSKGAAFTAFPGGPSGFASNDVTDGRFGADSFNPAYFNRATNNTAQPSFQTGFISSTVGQVVFNSAVNGFALKQAVIRPQGQDSYVYFNTVDTSLSGFRMISNTTYEFEGPITQIVAYSSVVNTPIDIVGIPVPRP